MNIQESDILYELQKEPYINQRILAESCGHSLGIVNRSLKNLEEEGYLDSCMQLTDKAKATFEKSSPRNAVIWLRALACGWFPSIWRPLRDFWKSTARC